MDFSEQQAATFEEADRRYAELKSQLDAGSISEEELDAQLRRLMVQDYEGRWWAKSRKTGNWCYHEGRTWIGATPPVYRRLGSAHSPEQQSRQDMLERAKYKPPIARRPGSRSGLLSLVASMVLIIAVGIVTAFAALGNNTGESVQTASENQQASSSEEPSAGGEGTDPAQEQATQDNPGDSRGGSDAEAAAVQALKDFYTSAAEKDYERSSNLLTAAARLRYFPSRDYFEGTFGTLNRIRFPQEPTAEVSGNTATITGETIAEHTNRTEQNRGTWTLVNEGGQWKLDNWKVQNERYL